MWNIKDGMNRDIIKYISVFVMLLNHIGIIFLESGPVLRSIFVNVGYFTAISMCYFLVEGYEYTRSKSQYAKRLLFFALVSEIPYCMAFADGSVIEFTGLNMLFTLFLCFLICLSMDKQKNRVLSVSCVLILVMCTVICDWGIGAPVFTLLFIWAKNSKAKTKIAFFLPTLLFGFYNFIARYGKLSLGKSILYAAMPMIGMGLAGICICCFYNGKRAERGKNFSKWFFYIFYPAHLLVLAIIRIMMSGKIIF